MPLKDMCVGSSWVLMLADSCLQEQHAVSISLLQCSHSRDDSHVWLLQSWSRLQKSRTLSLHRGTNSWNSSTFLQTKISHRKLHFLCGSWSPLQHFELAKVKPCRLCLHPSRYYCCCCCRQLRDNISIQVEDGRPRDFCSSPGLAQIEFVPY